MLACSALLEPNYAGLCSCRKCSLGLVLGPVLIVVWLCATGVVLAILVPDMQKGGQNTSVVFIFVVVALQFYAWLLHWVLARGAYYCVQNKSKQNKQHKSTQALMEEDGASEMEDGIKNKTAEQRWRMPQCHAFFDSLWQDRKTDDNKRDKFEQYFAAAEMQSRPSEHGEQDPLLEGEVDAAPDRNIDVVARYWRIEDDLNAKKSFASVANLRFQIIPFIMCLALLLVQAVLMAQYEQRTLHTVHHAQRNQQRVIFNTYDADRDGYLGIDEMRKMSHDTCDRPSSSCTPCPRPHVR